MGSSSLQSTSRPRTSADTFRQGKVEIRKMFFASSLNLLSIIVLSVALYLFLCSLDVIGNPITPFARFFSAKDIYLGELMSTVCGCTCECGQVWMHARRRGVGHRPDQAGGRLGVD